ncbi:hypothetical protein ACLB2K_046517 [Fragaria x ananassa]
MAQEKDAIRGRSDRKNDVVSPSETAKLGFDKIGQDHAREISPAHPSRIATLWCGNGLLQWIGSFRHPSRCLGTSRWIIPSPSFRIGMVKLADEKEKSSLLVAYPLWSKQWGTHSNGAIHWVSQREPGIFEPPVYAFDLTSEEFREMPLPVLSHNEDSLKMRRIRTPVLSGGCLCVLFQDDDECSEFWATKEYGVPKSWAKLFRFNVRDLPDVFSLFFSCYFWDPIFLAEKGTVVITLPKKMELFYLRLGRAPPSLFSPSFPPPSSLSFSRSPSRTQRHNRPPPRFHQFATTTDRPTIDNHPPSDHYQDSEFPTIRPPPRRCLLQLNRLKALPLKPRIAVTNSPLI